MAKSFCHHYSRLASKAREPLSGDERGSPAMDSSALLWRDTPYRLVEAARQREQVRVFAGNALLEELAEGLLPQ
jgi:hypothetical protein